MIHEARTLRECFKVWVEVMASSLLKREIASESFGSNSSLFTLPLCCFLNWRCWGLRLPQIGVLSQRADKRKDKQASV